MGFCVPSLLDILFFVSVFFFFFFFFIFLIFGMMWIFEVHFCKIIIVISNCIY